MSISMWWRVRKATSAWQASWTATACRSRSMYSTSSVPSTPAQPPARRPYLIMNPKSGGGKVKKFDLKRKAEELGAEVFLIGGPEPVDVAKVARQAAERSADLLGVAGGDGTQALVAGIAAEHGLPFVVISAAPAIISPSTWAWTARTRPRAWTRCPTASNCGSTSG